MSPVSKPAAKPEPRYRDCQSLRKWVRQTIEGQRMLDSMLRIACENCDKRRALEVKCAECEKQRSVLLLLFPDARLEYYASRGIRVHVETIPDFLGEEDLEWQYLDGMLDWLKEPWRTLYWPGLGAQEIARKGETVLDRIDGELKAHLIRELMEPAREQQRQKARKRLEEAKAKMKPGSDRVVTKV